MFKPSHPELRTFAHIFPIFLKFPVNCQVIFNLKNIYNDSKFKIISGHLQLL